MFEQGHERIILYRILFWQQRTGIIEGRLIERRLTRKLVKLPKVID